VPIAAATQEPAYARETRPRRHRWISAIGDLIFAALCMMIAAFFILIPSSALFSTSPRELER
jgi:uncharacterized membrane protein YdjX (TVP38/TMEM64 family)